MKPNTIVSILFALAIIIGLQGCASLNMELSIYKEDPTIDDRIYDAIHNIPSQLEKLEKATNGIAEDKLTIANMMHNLYRDYHHLNSRVVSEDYKVITANSELETLNRYHSEYTNKIKALKNNSIEKISDSRNSLAQLKRTIESNNNTPETATISDSNKISLLNSTINLLSNVVGSVKELIEYQDDRFTESIRFDALKGAISSSRLRKAANDADDQQGGLYSITPKAEYDQLLKNIESTSVALSSLNNIDINAIRTRVSEHKYNKAHNIVINDSNYAQIVDSLGIAFNLNEDSVNGGQLTSKLFSSTLLNSQLVRLQNPASPYWRTVTDPKNENKWNKQFSRTHFYAEGNSGVVIVRDSPIDYRIQEGANNPAALVQAQLGIARSVANAAIIMSGGGAGTPLVNEKLKPPPKTKTKTDTETVSIKTEEESLISEQSSLNRTREIQRNTINNMKSSITQYIANLANADPTNPTTFNAILDDLSLAIKTDEDIINTLTTSSD